MTGITRNVFVKRATLATFGFITAARGMVSPAAARAAYLCCSDPSKIHCHITNTYCCCECSDDLCQDYDCFDAVCADYCYSYTINLGPWADCIAV